MRRILRLEKDVKAYNDVISITYGITDMSVKITFTDGNELIIKDVKFAENYNDESAFYIEYFRVSVLETYIRFNRPVTVYVKNGRYNTEINVGI